jgi:hypothetical protein
MNFWYCLEHLRRQVDFWFFIGLEGHVVIANQWKYLHPREIQIHWRTRRSSS